MNLAVSFFEIAIPRCCIILSIQQFKFFLTFHTSALNYQYGHLFLVKFNLKVGMTQSNVYKTHRDCRNSLALSQRPCFSFWICHLFTVLYCYSFVYPSIIVFVTYIYFCPPKMPFRIQLCPLIFGLGIAIYLPSLIYFFATVIKSVSRNLTIVKTSSSSTLNLQPLNDDNPPFTNTEVYAFAIAVVLILVAAIICL